MLYSDQGAPSGSLSVEPLKGLTSGAQLGGSICKRWVLLGKTETPSQSVGYLVDNNMSLRPTEVDSAARLGSSASTFTTTNCDNQLLLLTMHPNCQTF